MPRLRRVRQRLTINETRQRHDRILMGNEQSLAPPRLTQRCRQRGTHPRRDIAIRLPPGRTQRIAVILVVLRVGQHRAIRINCKPLKDVIRFNEARIGSNAQTIGGGSRRRRQLGTQQGRRDDAGNIRPRIHQISSTASRHLIPQLRQPKTRQPAVQNAGGIVHFSVTHDVNDGAVHNRQV